MRSYIVARTFQGTWPALAGAALLLLACGGAAQKPDATPETKPAPTARGVPDEPAPPEALETGKDCASAMVQCEDGVCTAKVKNDCDTPVTCELSVQSGCRMDGTATGEARAANKVTVRSKETDEVSAWGNCEGGTLVFTEVVGMECK